MILQHHPLRVVEALDRRVLGAFQLLDAATALPVGAPVHVEARAASIGATSVPLTEHAVRIVQNRRGVCVLFRAPFFDTYAATFLNPVNPPETAVDPLRLTLAITDGGPHHLPQEFQLTLPRSLDPAATNTVFQPQPIRVFRVPSAPVQDGWAVLRVRVTQAGTNPLRPLPGVLVRVFRSPRAAADPPIGEGMTDWRGAITGEAVVPIAGVPRFQPGAGQNVVVSDQPIVFEASRHSGFTGAGAQLPDGPALLAGAGAGLIRPPAVPANSQLTVLRPAGITPAEPMLIKAAREFVVHLAMP